MESSLHYDSMEWDDSNICRQSGHGESRSSQMVVSDDDASIVRAGNTTGYANNDAVSIGTSTSQMLTESNPVVLDGPHRITPLVRDSEVAMERKNTGANKNIDGDSNLPFCLFHLTDDSQTQFTIRRRGGACERASQTGAQASQIRLVDKYAVKESNESTERHDFNACQTLKPEDTSQVRKGINKNLVASPTRTTHHKISPTQQVNIHNKPNQQEQDSQQLHNQKNLTKHLSHKISFQLDETNTGKMPSKQVRCLPRQRSRAIAIKRSRPGEFVDTSIVNGNNLEKEAKQCDVELYDYATWRMYNRIIDHRRKNPVPIHHQEDHHLQVQQLNNNNSNLKNSHVHSSDQEFSTSSIDEDNAATMLHQSPMANGPRYLVLNNAMYTADDYVSGNEDDEIFDLEL